MLCMLFKLLNICCYAEKMRYVFFYNVFMQDIVLPNCNSKTTVMYSWNQISGKTKSHHSPITK